MIVDPVMMKSDSFLPKVRTCTLTGRLNTPIMIVGTRLPQKPAGAPIKWAATVDTADKLSAQPKHDFSHHCGAELHL